MTSLPKGWKLATLDQLNKPDAPICYGVLKPGERDPHGVAMVRVTDIKNNYFNGQDVITITPALDEEFRRSRIVPEDVLISVQGTVGRIAVVPIELRGANISRTIARVRPALRDLTRWLWLILRSPQAQSLMFDETGGTTRDSLNIGDLRLIEIPVAPRGEQRRIVSKIDSLSAKSNHARAQLDHIPRLVEKYKRSILASAFRGDLTRAWRVSAGLGNTWKETSLGPTLVDIRYGTAKKCSYDRGALGVLRIPNVQHGHITLNDIKFADFGQSELEALRLEEGDILLIRSNGSLDLVGRSAVVHQAAAGMLFAGYLIRLRVDRTVVRPQFIQLYLQTADVRVRLERLAKSTSGVNNINSTQIKSLPLLHPVLDEQDELVQRVYAAFAWVDRLASETRSARNLIDHLDQAFLAKAFQGELVPQDPGDEPASVLLERISTGRSATAATRSAVAVRRKGRGHL